MNKRNWNGMFGMGPLGALIMLIGAMSIGADTSSCNSPDPQPKSASGVDKVTVKVPVGPDHLTTEQRNVVERLRRDNEPGSIKHLYVISAYSGQVLIYSTVKGKVTSSGKRLSPTSVKSVWINDSNGTGYRDGFTVDIGGQTGITQEILQDDGTYGSSTEYLYWFDTKGVYHQHYVQGGQILHVSSEPIGVKSVVINMEISAAPGTTPSDAQPTTTAQPTTITAPTPKK